MTKFDNRSSRELCFDESRFNQHLQERPLPHSPGDSVRPRTFDRHLIGRDVRLQQDVSHLEPTARFQDPENLTQDPRLVQAELEHSVGDHQIDRGISNGQRLDLPRRNTTFLTPEREALWQALAIISGVMSRPMTFPRCPLFGQPETCRSPLCNRDRRRIFRVQARQARTGCRRRRMIR